MNGERGDGPAGTGSRRSGRLRRQHRELYLRGVSRPDGETDPFDPPARIFTTWYSPHGNCNHETRELSNPTRVYTFTVSRSAPWGAHLDKPFWLVVSWYDTDDRNEITSDTAYCQ